MIVIVKKQRINSWKSYTRMDKFKPGIKLILHIIKYKLRGYEIEILKEGEY